MARSGVVILAFHRNSSSIPICQRRQDRGRPIPPIIADITFSIPTRAWNPVGGELAVDVLLGGSGVIVAGRGPRAVHVDGAFVLPSF